MAKVSTLLKEEITSIIKSLQEERKQNQKLLKIGELLRKIFPHAFRTHRPSSKALIREDISTPTRKPPYFDPQKPVADLSKRSKWVLSHCKDNPTLYVGGDGSKFIMSQGGVVRFKGVVHTPGDNPIKFHGGFSSKLNVPGALDVDMFEAEAQGLRCMLHRLHGEPLDCRSEQYGCPVRREDCELKRLKPMRGRTVAFFDRPISSMYFQDFRGSQRERLIGAQKRLFECCERFDTPLIGVVVSSKAHDIIDTIMNLLDHTYGYYLNPANEVAETVVEWIEGNMDLAVDLARSGGVPEPKTVINEIISRHFSHEYRTIDFQLVDGLVGSVEERTVAFEINKRVRPYDDTLGRWYPRTQIEFFYVGYLVDWARVEYVYARPEEAYLHYLVQSTIMPTYYPAVLAISHKLCAIHTRIAELIRMIASEFGVKDSLKILTKRLF
ncbi:MAG: hypothetical protein Q6367_002585 [Candidatus Freyarchaeota archaeon]